MSKLSIENIFVTSGVNGSGIFEILEYINTLIPE
jgi:hypothetical protein